MAIPKYNELFNDVLSELSDKNEYKTSQLKEIISNKLDLTEEEKIELLPSKADTTINSRIGWAITYLKKANFIESKKRGYVNITEDGLDLFNKNHNITLDDLLKVPEFVEWKNPKPQKIEPTDSESVKVINFSQTTPEEEMEESFKKINDELAEKILENILNKEDQ